MYSGARTGSVKSESAIQTQHESTRPLCGTCSVFELPPLGRYPPHESIMMHLDHGEVWRSAWGMSYDDVWRSRKCQGCFEPTEQGEDLIGFKLMSRRTHRRGFHVRHMTNLLSNKKRQTTRGGKWTYRVAHALFISPDGIRIGGNRGDFRGSSIGFRFTIKLSGCDLV